MKKLYSSKKNLNTKNLIEGSYEKRQRNLKVACLTTAIVLLTSVSTTLAPKEKYVNPGVSYNSSFVVAHAGGALENENGKTLKYLNCVEGFYKYYEEGTRLFEYDLVFSSDGKLVGTHKFEYLKNYSLDNRISYNDYINTKIAGKYNGITEDLLLELALNFPNCKFIVDTKEENPTKVYQRIVDVANEKEIDISNQILPFVSSKEMLKDINNMYNFNEIMFTNYKEYYPTEELLKIIDGCDKIKYLHIFPIDFFKVDIDEINKKNVRVFAHMDSSSKSKLALNYGCSGIFSDDISENMFKENYYSLLADKLEVRKINVQVPKQNKISNEIDFSL